MKNREKTTFVIEIDGNSHEDDIIAIKDEHRQQILEELGFSFIRFCDQDIKMNLKNAIQTIVNFILDYEDKNPPSPLSKGGI